MKDILWESKSQVIHLFFRLQLNVFRGLKCNGFSLIVKSLKLVNFYFVLCPVVCVGFKCEGYTLGIKITSNSFVFHATTN